MKSLISVKWFCVFTFAVVNLFGFCGCQNSGNRLIGGLFEERPANAEIMELVTNVQIPITQAIRSKRFGAEQNGTLTPISYRTQLVNGINYFIKVQTKVGSKVVYYNVRIHKTFDGTIKFNRVEGPIRPEATLRYF